MSPQTSAESWTTVYGTVSTVSRLVLGTMPSSQAGISKAVSRRNSFHAALWPNGQRQKTRFLTLVFLSFWPQGWFKTLVTTHAPPTLIQSSNSSRSAPSHPLDNKRLLSFGIFEHGSRSSSIAGCTLLTIWPGRARSELACIISLLNVLDSLSILHPLSKPPAASLILMIDLTEARNT